jgi:hypothetical protein
MLARWKVPLLDGARRFEAAFPLEEQFHAFSAAEAANGSDVSSQVSLL